MAAVTVLARIEADAAARGETLGQAVRHHLLRGVLARLAHTPHGPSFVLRGGLATRAWISPARRITRDLDFVGDFPFDVDDTVRRFAPALAVTLPDDVIIEPGSLAAQGIWLDTAFPGVRLRATLGLGMADEELMIDVGFHDPLVPAATTLALGDVSVRACRPETQVGWKLHGLAERGASFRPKDLADLQLILRHVTLDAADLPPAIVAAFTSRGYTIADALAVLDAPHWATKTSRLRWESYKTELADTVADVRDRLGPTFAALRDRR